MIFSAIVKQTDTFEAEDEKMERGKIGMVGCC
jgi:hypothetical protein